MPKTNHSKPKTAWNRMEKMVSRRLVGKLLQLLVWILDICMSRALFFLFFPLFYSSSEGWRWNWLSNCQRMGWDRLLGLTDMMWRVIIKRLFSTEGGGAGEHCWQRMPRGRSFEDPIRGRLPRGNARKGTPTWQQPGLSTAEKACHTFPSSFNSPFHHFLHAHSTTKLTSSFFLCYCNLV